MDIYKIVSNSKKTVTDTLNSNKAVEVYPNNFIPTRYKPTKDKTTNTIVKSNNSISNFDKEIERIKKVQAIEDIRYLNDKDKRFNNLNTYINSDKVNQILCSGDLHINKDAVSQPVDEKLITKGAEDIYSNEDISYNNESDKKEIDNTMKSCKLWVQHFESASGFSKRNGVSGAHTIDAFNKYFCDIGLKFKEISKITHPTVDGVYDIEYQVQARDYKGIPIEGQYNKPIYKKTIIDTKKISIDTIKLWANEAYKNGIKISSSNNKTYFKGISSNGLKFEGWINPDTEEFESLYPVLEWQK